ncbi:hypothetical protein AAL_05485 [Moelleriella libera RCEF 2490]|uniref:Uncharacterized protein n=1 Tax=Moelleriella libera RCEF 2490 TaxID=1081109 RepID=A0A168ACV0_9HYPO|nr:hypothetical protein AAL_05485 [Moelleriella libera RCEF 2490]
MGGLYFQQGRVGFPLSALQYARDPRVFNLPPIPEHAILDKNKHDDMAEFLAIIQISQLGLSLAVRGARGQHFFAVGNADLGTVYLWRVHLCCLLVQAPKYQCPFTVRLRDRTETRFMRDVLGGYSDKTYDNFWNIITNHGWHSKKGRSRMEIDNMPHSSSSIARLATPVLAILPTAFGCIHHTAWNFDFPTEIEQLAWRIAVSTSAATPLIGLPVIPLAQIIVQFGDPCAFVYDRRHILQVLSRVAALMTNSIQEDDNPAGNDDFGCVIADLQKAIGADTDSDDARIHFRDMFEAGGGDRSRRRIVKSILDHRPTEEGDLSDLSESQRHFTCLKWILRALGRRTEDIATRRSWSMEIPITGPLSLWSNGSVACGEMVKTSRSEPRYVAGHGRRR